MSDVRVELILLWHQHQPDYRDPRSGRSQLPWVRLHATKDYVDMARRLEPFPRVKATFNFVPSLVDQIEAAAAGEPDELFELLALAPRDLSREQRRSVTRRGAQIPAHARVARPALNAIAAAAENGADLSDDDLLTLEIGFLLGWLDPSFHAEPEAAAAIGAPARLELRDGLLALHRRLLDQVIPVHRRLLERGQIELSTSPYYHPILPLLMDVSVASRSRPDLPLPRRPFAAPDDARRQLERAIARHAEVFGRAPRGAWPSEGSVSPEVAELAAGVGLAWLASDQGVLERSLDERMSGAHFRPWRLDTRSGPLHLFFRDHELSDRIGFVYQRWKAADAVADFLDRLRKIGGKKSEDAPIVSVMLDGENCWEGYEEDGGPFLDRLYGALDAADDIGMTTPAEVLSRAKDWPRLSRLHSGSWIDADFHVWAGHPEKNRAWDLLAHARERLVAHSDAPEAAWDSLLKAEGSDWFWWLGDDHYTSDKALYDRLFREHLRAIYEACGEAVPPEIEVPIAAAAKPTREEVPAAFMTPVIDGRQTDFYEWQAAGRRAIAGAGGAMHAGRAWIRDLYYGFDRRSIHLRVDFLEPPGESRALRIEWLEPAAVRHEIRALAPGRPAIERAATRGAAEGVPGATACLDSVLEMTIPLEALSTRPGDRLSFFVQVLERGRPVETAPASDVVRLQAPDESLDAAVWSP